MRNKHHPIVVELVKIFCYDLTMSENGLGSQQRYLPHTLKTGEADIKHFIPVNGLEDRFGNRIFRSSRLIYSDRSHDQVRAALLVSSAGREFIRSNPKILRDIDRGLTLVRRDQPVEISPGRRLERWKGGSQSWANLLTIDGQRFVVKTQSTGIAAGLYSQPFINEMLQVQASQTDLGDKLDQFRVEMPTFFFASGQVSCVEFVEGTEAVEDDLRPFVNRLYRTVKNYVDDQEDAGNRLWEGVFIDLMKFYPITQIRANNFVKRPDVKLVWIDPFFFR